MGVTLEGQEAVRKQLKELSNPHKTFDADVRKVALKRLKFLKIGTKSKGRVKTGNTSRGWSKPTKLNLSLYRVQNKIHVKSYGKTYNIVRILDEGHGVIKPRRAKMLYIPLTNKGAAKGRGFKSGLKVGLNKRGKPFKNPDAVFAKSAKATKGRKFLARNKIESEKFLLNLMIRRIDKL